MSVRSTQLVDDIVTVGVNLLGAAEVILAPSTPYYVELENITSPPVTIQGQVVLASFEEVQT